MKKQEDNYTIIIGCGRLGSLLATSLSNQGRNVIIIDNNEHSFKKLSPSYGGLTLTGDACSISTLQEANTQKANVLVSVTDDDNTNIMVAQIAKEIFKVPHVICRLYDPECECVYKEFGIKTICPAVLSANEISNLLGSNIYSKEL